MTLVAEAGVANDGFRDPRGPGAHEWWYFDAVDPATGTALVIIFFRGIPFSGQRQKHDQRPADEFPAVAFSLYPVGVAELMAVSDAGEIMPPKSTWFEPKLRDGLLNHLI